MQIGAANLVLIEEQRCVEVGTRSAEPHQVRNAPRHNHEQRQRRSNRSTIDNCIAPTLQPFFSTLKNISISQRARWLCRAKDDATISRLR